MNMRHFRDVSFRAKDDIIGTLRFKVEGGTTGDHFVKFDGDNWYCDCIGFRSHGHCRHVDGGKKILLYIYKAIDDINNPREEIHVLN